MLKLSAALFVVVLAGCSLTRSEEDPVQVRLNDLDARLAKLERIMSNQSLLDMAQHLDAVQADVRTVRGQVDELQNGSEAMRKQQRDLYTDLDRRLAERGAAGGVGGQAGAAGATPAGSVSAADQAAYAQAFNALKNGNYAAAIAGFKQYLANYPTSDLADNAQYWLGEAYYVTRDYDNAAPAFRAVGEHWPNSRKAPDALLKLGFTQFELKQYADARSSLTQVTKRFPDSEAAKLAAERLKRLPPDGQ
ncbi:MAG TPA: tol-pal system protein YbgF [Steroidobacteraceae bacterium]